MALTYRIAWLLVGFAMVLMAGSLYAEDRINISTGVVFPSDNSALFENPAALRNSVTTPEVLIGWGDRTNSAALEGSLVAGFGVAGVGGALDYVNKDWIGTVGAGVDLLGTGVGLNISNGFDSNSPSLDAGVQFGGKSGITLGLVLRDLTDGINQVVAGLGAATGEIVRVEGDLEWITDADDFFLNPAVGIKIPQTELDFAAGYRFQLIDGSRANSGEGQFRIGANYWLDPVSVEFLYNFRLEEFVAGMKFKI